MEFGKPLKNFKCVIFNFIKKCVLKFFENFTKLQKTDAKILPNNPSSEWIEYAIGWKKNLKVLQLSYFTCVVILLGKVCQGHSPKI